MFCPGVAGISCPAEEVKPVATIGGNSEPGGRSVSNQQTMTCYGFSYEKCLRQTNNDNGNLNEKPCHHILSRQIRIIHAVVQEWLPRVKDPSNLELFFFFHYGNVVGLFFTQICTFWPGAVLSPPATFGQGSHPLAESLVLLRDLSEPRYFLEHILITLILDTCKAYLHNK